MKRILLRSTLVVLLFAVSGTFTNCAKSGCPASMALQNETMGEPGKKQKKSKQPKSGIIAPEGRKGKKY